MAHRVLRLMATRLSESGYHVLRFDYYGTGDSAGEREEGDLGTWQDDAEEALEELRDMSGFTSVATFGIRLGAVVAWRLALSRTDVHTAVLWDPVVHGTEYVRELSAAQAQTDRWLLLPVQRRNEPDGVQDVLGFPLSLSMRRTIEVIEPAMYSAPTPARVKLFFSAQQPQDSIRRALHASGTPVHVETIDNQLPWREEEESAGGPLPVRAVERMVEVLK